MPTTPSPPDEHARIHGMRILMLWIRTGLTAFMMLLTTGMVNHGHDLWALVFFVLGIEILFVPVSSTFFPDSR